jgi:hypothetical protein
MRQAQVAQWFGACAKTAPKSLSYRNAKKSMAHSIGTWMNISDADPNPNPRLSTPFCHWTYPLSQYFFCAKLLAQGLQSSKGDLRHCARRIDRNDPETTLKHD